MSWARTLALALRTLRRNPLRSLFMLLGVAVGIASLVAMASVGEATRQETMRQFKRMVGTFDRISIQPGSARTRGMPSLTSVEPTLRFEDADAIRAEVPNVRRVSREQSAFDIDVQARDKTATTSIWGISAEWMEIRGDDVTVGRGISPEDVETLARVAVIGEDLRKELFPDEDPIGKTIRIAEVPFTVQGVLVPRGAGPGGSSLDNLLLMPVSTASKRLFNRDYLTTITVQLEDPARYEQAVAAITALLRERHGIVPPVEDNFTVSNPRAAMEQVQEVDTTLSAVLVGIAVIATLIGGVVIMSLMLIAVSERRREIGVRRAVGATRADVLRQFLVEAALISALGGIVGVLLGVAGATVAAFQQQLSPVFLWGAMGGAVGLATLIGLVFGLQPAWRAANVDPIQALRA
ncbi:MAG: ABC transporter permease [Chromatiales bacterium]|nr:ABC transporter permease [Chromatiales bacterium]